MLPREKRLTKSRDFERVYQKGKRLKGESFNLIFLDKKRGQTRIGIVVGKKFSKKATDRNRQKRIFREAANGLYGDIKGGLDIVIFVRNFEKSYKKKEDAERDLLEFINKVGINK